MAQVVIDQVREALRLQRTGLQPRIQEHEFAIEVRARAVRAEDRALTDGVACIQSQRTDLSLCSQCIESLLVLTPAHIAQKPCIVVNDTLAPKGDGEILVSKGGLQPVEFEIVRIGDHGKGLYAIYWQRIVVFVHQRQRAFGLGQQAERAKGQL